MSKCILTFDIEDWFHVLDNEETNKISLWQLYPSILEEGVLKILDFLERRKITATHFILGWVADHYPDLIAEIQRRGHEIACHSYAHQLVYQQSPRDFDYDLSRAIDAIHTATGVVCKAYRAPGFSITKDSLWALDILSESGIEVDSSIFLHPRAHGGLQVPGLTVPSRVQLKSGRQIDVWPLVPDIIFGRKLFLSGGGYFRVTPKHVLFSAFNKNNYRMSYFHPRDFFEKIPKVSGISPFRQWKLSVGGGGALKKLDLLSYSVDFISLAQATQGTMLNEVHISYLEGNHLE